MQCTDTLPVSGFSLFNGQTGYCASYIFFSYGVWKTAAVAVAQFCLIWGAADESRSRSNRLPTCLIVPCRFVYFLCAGRR